MKILQVLPRYFPDRGGVERHVQFVSEALARLGHEVVVATGMPSIPNEKQCVIKGVRVCRCAQGGVYPYLIPRGLFTFLKTNAPCFDAIHAYNYHALPLLITMLACGDQTVISPCYHRTAHSATADALHLIYDPIAVFMLRKLKAAVCLSRGEAEQFVQRLRVPVRKVRVIPSGIALPSHFQPSKSIDTVELLSVGRLEAYKRVDCAINALSHLPEQYTLMIVGRGPERARLMDIAVRLSLQHRVSFLGEISDEQLREQYLRSRVVISLSEAESFGIAVLEALSYGRHVVCSDIPAFRDLAKDFAGMTHLVSTSVGSPQLAEIIQGAAAQTQKLPAGLCRYDWTAITHDLLQVYTAD
jgi:glycosyltransferase involved in cell wall biosynthesis